MNVNISDIAGAVETCTDRRDHRGPDPGSRVQRADKFDSGRRCYGHGPWVGRISSDRGVGKPLLAMGHATDGLSDVSGLRLEKNG